MQIKLKPKSLAATIATVAVCLILFGLAMINPVIIVAFFIIGVISFLLVMAYKLFTLIFDEWD